MAITKIEKRNTKGSTASITKLLVCQKALSRGRDASPRPGEAVWEDLQSAFSPRNLRGRCEARVDNGAVPRQGRALHDLVVPVDRELLLLLVDQGFQEGQQILGVKRRSRRREA